MCGIAGDDEKIGAGVLQEPRGVLEMGKGILSSLQNSRGPVRDLGIVIDKNP
jgi:hypothetical protein